uniref:Dihydroflavonol-4-reductase n=1 Tax=Nicotiana tabacum TaxID=4097 RepID=A0A1S3Y386_TOBAC|nr:PREDICTED: putative dihydroflavonol-4-reductase [Nicotiana tabacum]
MNKTVILVTGASGYLGGRLCQQLFNAGQHVKIISHSFKPATGCHVIFHAAALVELWLPDPSRFFSVNVGGLKNVLQAYKETGTIEKIVYTSSFFALGSTDGYIANETQTHTGKFFCTEYEKSKAVADKVALDAASEGMPIVPVYPGLIYGPGKVTSANIVARMFCQIIERYSGRLPGYIGQANERFSFSHVDDVVDGHIAAMDKGKSGERYLLTGENASFKEVFDIAAMITQTKRPSFGIPLLIVEAYGWISIIFSKLTGKLPLISPPIVSAARHQWAYSCEKAKEELDYNPRSLKEGLSEVLPWLKSLGLIEY